MRASAISKVGIPDVIDELRTLLAILIRAPIQDAPIGQERYVNGYDRPRKWGTKKATLNSSRGGTSNGWGRREGFRDCRGPADGEISPSRRSNRRTRAVTVIDRSWLVLFQYNYAVNRTNLS
jgi:hypothetical protein